jgi:hypothetical protein
LKHDHLVERFDEETGKTIPVFDYVALSYRWGDASITRSIIVNGEVVQVTTNLEAGLRVLRSLKAPEIFWIDSLCINQNDLQERDFKSCEWD